MLQGVPSFYRLELWDLFSALGRELPIKLQTFFNAQQLQEDFLRIPSLPSWSEDEQLRILGIIDTNSVGFKHVVEHYSQMQLDMRTMLGAIWQLDAAFRGMLRVSRLRRFSTEIAIWLRFLSLYRHINGLLWIAAATQRMKAKLR